MILARLNQGLSRILGQHGGFKKRFCSRLFLWIIPIFYEYLLCSSEKISLFGGEGEKTGFHFTGFVSVSISSGENDKLRLGKASAASCVLLSNISGGELGCRCVYITCKISCKTLRGRGLHLKCLLCCG